MEPVGQCREAPWWRFLPHPSMSDPCPAAGGSVEGWGVYQVSDLREVPRVAPERFRAGEGLEDLVLWRW